MAVDAGGTAFAQSAYPSVSVPMTTVKVLVAPIRPDALGVISSLQIGVVGAGYVGLVTAACLAHLGHRVIAVDANLVRIADLARGKMPFHEPDLEAMVVEQTRLDRLSFTSDLGEASIGVDLLFIAVGTPPAADGGVSTEAVDAVVAQLADMPRLPALIVMKSTVPVGTSSRIENLLAGRPGIGNGNGNSDSPKVASNPEFLREGTAVDDFLTPDRIVAGFDGDPQHPAMALLRRVFQPLTSAGAAWLQMDTRSAELSKFAANAMLATRVSFINEIASIAEVSGADIAEVCRGIGSDPRIGASFIEPGLGYGGSCLPKDVSALRHIARQHHLRADILTATERVNSRQRSWPVHAIARWTNSWAQSKGARIAIWGLAFKPGTDDMHDAPALPLIERLRRMGMNLSLYDPAAMDNARALLTDPRGIRWCQSAEQALEGSELLLLVTEWDEFREFPPEVVANHLTQRMVFDGRNALDPIVWSEAGLQVVQVGRPAVPPVRSNLKRVNER